ncbi:MAG TPA: glycosyltransferase family 2 protein [Amycolatopsis sp.]|nr:glycosyltransferase family 2 protein [Amycolatopsis sp.]
MTEPTRYGDGLAVVVVTYFPGDDLERFLETLEKATTRDVRVVLADNDSADDALDKAARRKNVHLLRIGENLGYGAAANRGVAELDDSYGWVVVANPDLEWEPGSLDVLLDVTKRWPRAGAFGPLIKDPDGTVYPSARLLPSLGRGMGHAVFGKVWPANPWTRAYRQEREPVERTSGWLSGSCQMFRREAFDSVDGFDPRYFMYFEDVDLGDRIGQAGWLNVYAPSAAVTHIGGTATSRAPKKMLAAHHESAYRYLADRHRGLAWKPVLAAVKLGLNLRLRLETRGR